MAKLNEGISQIKKGSALETMYNRLLTGMEQASHETLPDFTGSDYVDGYVVNEEKINLEIHEYENITRKNSAYLLANTIISSLSSEEGGGSGTGGFVSINGDVGRSIPDLRMTESTFFSSSKATFRLLMVIYFIVSQPPTLQCGWLQMHRHSRRRRT